MITVFVDTSALLPLINRDDQDHPAILNALKKLAKNNATLITSSYVLVETGALVKSRLGRDAFVALGLAVKDAIEVIWIDADLHHRAWDQTALETKKGPGFVDWVSFLLMQDLKIDHALTLDRHFKKQGFQILP